MRNTTLERLTWVLIYGGLLALGLGLAVLQQDARFGWLLVLAGGAAAAGGVVLIAVRARRRDDPPA